MNLTFTLALDKNKLIDVSASIAAAEGAIRRRKAELETEETNILAALNAVFDAGKGTRVNMPYVINQALQLLGVAETPGAYKTMYDRVHAFIQSNSQGKVDKLTKIVERPDSLFVVGKGKNGGLQRRADIASATTAAQKQTNAPSRAPSLPDTSSSVVTLPESDEGEDADDADDDGEDDDSIQA